MTVLLLGSMAIFFVIGVPAFVALGLPAVLVVFLDTFPMNILPQRIFFGLDRFGLMAIPYFIFCAEVMGRGQVGIKLVTLARVLCGHLPGGMAIVTVVACLMFGAIAGAGMAGLLAFGALLYKLMRGSGYPENFAAGLISMSSNFAQSIPPSLMLVTFATVTGVSTAALFLAGLSAGLLFAFSLAIFSIIYSIKTKLPRMEKVPWSKRWKPIREALWALGMLFIVFVGIYGGYLSITEAAGFAAFYALLVELIVYRSMKIKDIYPVAAKAAKTTSMIMILIATGGLIAWFLTMWQVPQMAVALLGDAHPIIVLLLVNLIFLVFGLVLEPATAVVVLMPIVFFPAVAVGIHPLHLGAIVILNLSIGMVTPPLGVNLFVGTSVFGLSFARMSVAVLPFIGITLILLLVISLFPQLVTWLPTWSGLA